MLKKFKTKAEAEVYLKEEKILIQNKQSNLSYSEREKIKNNQITPETLVTKEEKIKLPIITNINELSKPCQEVNKEDKLTEIIQKLKNTLVDYEGYGITGNQIGINKRISYIKIPKIKDKKLEFTELILINAKIIEKDRPIKIQNEGCLSLPGVYVSTKRYVFITVSYLDENLKEQISMFQDLKSFVVQHEISHQYGETIFNYKWRDK